MTYRHHAERRSRGAIRWLAAGALIVLAAFGIAFAVMLTGNATPGGAAGHHKPQALAAASAPTTSAPAQSASPSPSASASKPTHKRVHSASPSPAPGHTSRPPVTGPQPTHPPAKPPPAATVKLAAAISADGWHDSPSGGRVSFQVDDTGTAATGQLSVTITLPAGASVMAGPGGGWGGGGDAQLSPFDGNGGWSCQATSAGATCSHAAVAASSQAAGEIYFTVSGGPACGQPVSLTAAAGSASAGAQTTVSC